MARSKSTRLSLRMESLESRWTPAAGDLDASFGTGGKVQTDFASSYDYATDMVLQADGKIVLVGAQVVGDLFDPTSADFAVARYNADGSLDEGFGTGGKVTTDYETDSTDGALSVAIQGDGRILVAGNSSTAAGFAIVRYNTDGTIDSSFGTNGRIVTGFSTGDAHNPGDIAIDALGRIVVVGSNFNANVESLAVARFDANGDPDLTFDSDGIAITTFGTSTFNIGHSLAIDSQGRIVVGGQTSFPVGEFENDDDMALARFMPDGTLDSTFGTGGKTTLAFGTSLELIHSLVVDDTDRVVAAGFSHRTGGFDMAVVRYKEDGTLDPTFDADGKVRVTFPGASSDAHAVKLDGSGRIVIAGSANGAFGVARLTSTGSLDSTFGSAGKSTTSFGNGFSGAEAIAFDVDGKAVVGGSYDPGQDASDFVLARFLTTGGGGGGSGGTAALVGDDLIVQGTTSDDVFQIRPAKTAGEIEVFSGRVSLGQFAESGIVGKIIVRGLDGNDRLSLTSKITKPAEIDGGIGDDVVTGGAGKDTLIGGVGNDKLSGGLNDDIYLFGEGWGTDRIIESGKGIDRLDFSAVSAGVTFTQSGAARTGDSANTLTIGGKMEILVGGSGNDTLTSVGTSTWSLNGTNAGTVRTLDFLSVESLVGGNGLDRLVVAPAGSLSGTFDGGRGKNTLDYSGFATAITVNLKAGTATALGGVSNVADVIGGTGDDLIVGSDVANALAGGSGRDILIGGGMADRLSGGAQDDLLVAGLVSFVLELDKLNDLRAEWSSGNTYAQKITNLTQGGGANGTTVLDALTVTDDSRAVDQLNGETGTDWFVTNTRDKVLRPETEETATLI